MSTRSRNVLSFEGIRTTDDAFAFMQNPEALTRAANFGRSSWNEILQILNEYGYPRIDSAKVQKACTKIRYDAWKAKNGKSPEKGISVYFLESELRELSDILLSRAIAEKIAKAITRLT